MGATETAHVTLHPDGTVNFRKGKLSKGPLRHAIKTNLVGWEPKPSLEVKEFLLKVRNKI